MDEIPTSNVYTYNAGTGGRYIVEMELGRKNITPLYDRVQNWTFNVTGTYSGQRVVSIRFYVSGPSKGWRVYVTNTNGAETLIAVEYQITGQAAQNSPLASQLSFAYTSGGKTFRLTDLPTQDPHITGAVWRNGNQLMISV